MSANNFIALQRAGLPLGMALAVADAKDVRIAALRAACAAAIGGGFPSAALGATHTYPMDATSQTNLSGSVLASLLPGLAADWTTPFWCADAAGNWAFAPHSAAQIQQAGTDAKAWVVSCQQKLAALIAQVAAIDPNTGTAEAVEAVLWA